jgi:hypothetical protein
LATERLDNSEMSGSTKAASTPRVSEESKKLLPSSMKENLNK